MADDARPSACMSVRDSMTGEQTNLVIVDDPQGPSRTASMEDGTSRWSTPPASKYARTRASLHRAIRAGSISMSSA